MGDFVDVGVLVGAQQDFLAAGDVGVTFLAAGVDGLLYEAFVDLLEEAAVLLDVEEELPGLLCDGHGECLDVVRAAGGVDDLVHVALFLEQELLVAGDALAELVGFLVSDVEGGDCHRVNAGDGCREGLGLATQQVDVCVVDGLVETRGDGVAHHLLGAGARGVVLTYDFGPEHAGGAEFGDLHEEVRRYAHVEFDAAGNLGGVKAGVGEQCHPVGAPCQGVTQLLEDVGTGVAEHVGVYREHAQTLDGSDGLD